MYKIYVGNLSFQSTDEDLRNMFTEFGEVASVNVITDRDTGRSRGFGFVEMPDAAEGKAAAEALNGKELDGRTLTVNEARPRAPRSGGGGGGRGDRW